MVWKCRARRARALFPLVIVACALSCTAAPPAPAPAAAARPAPPPPELSTIVVPIEIDLASLARDVEAHVQRTFAGKETERGIDVRYDVAREPIALEMIGAGLHATTTIKYALEACRGRFPCISCGFGEPRRVADIRLQTKLDWDPSWRIRSATRLLPVNYPRPCEVTWLDLDITRRFVAPVVEQQLGLAARIIDRNTPALTNLRPRAEQIWTSIQTPTELAPRTWLVLEPTDLALTPLGGSGRTATTTLILRAQTRAVLGERPAIVRKPLPALKTMPASGPASVRVPFDLELPYEEATRLAAREYASKTFTIEGRTLTIESLRIAPAEGGRVLVEAAIDYRGGLLRNYRGAVFLEGTPRFDPATSRIVVPDLDYSLDPKRRGFLTRIAERAAHETIRQRLRESARFDLAPRMQNVRNEVTRALNRPLAPGVTLQGRVDAIEPAAVTPLADVISLRVVATGTATVVIR